MERQLSLYDGTRFNDRRGKSLPEYEILGPFLNFDRSFIRSTYFQNKEKLGW